jgi:D-sedoheptulose 7-phosphate isomerase
MLHPRLAELIERYPSLNACADSLSAALDALKSTFTGGGKVLLCGNGGSNADCDHIAAELMKSFMHPRPIPTVLRERLMAQSNPHSAEIAQCLQGGLPAISLGAHTSLASAVANDTCASMIFAQQVYALAKPGDLLWGISTSGNSINVLRAILTAKALDVKTLGLTGAHGGKLSELCDVTIQAPAERVDVIQELHLPIYHALCAAVEDVIFAK